MYTCQHKITYKMVCLLLDWTENGFYKHAVQRYKKNNLI